MTSCGQFGFSSRSFPAAISETKVSPINPRMFFAKPKEKEKEKHCTHPGLYFSYPGPHNFSANVDKASSNQEELGQ